MSELVRPTDGMVITRDTTFAPGVYVLPHGVEIAADHVTLDGNGAVLVGDGFAGRGVSIRQRNGVTLRNLSIERYFHGVWVSGSTAVQLIRNRVRHTHELAGPDVFLDVWLDRASAYGGGMYLAGVVDSLIAENDLQHQQNGLLLYGCENLEIARNNASFNSGYGMLLYESSRNTVEDNVADFCCRIYHYTAEPEPYHNGADAAGLVMMCSSSGNIVRRNRFRSGGDGVFLGGFHRDQIKVPCNDNVFEGNDGSNSPNIAFEATFSQGNVFRANRADNCNYGFWLGYSSRTTVEANSIRANRTAGVAIEHGFANVIRDNRFEHNRDGCQFWIGAKPAFTDYFPECAESHDTLIASNTFRRNESGVRVWTERGAASPARRCRNFTVSGNTLEDNRVAVSLERAQDCIVQDNAILGNLEAGVRLVGCASVAAESNRFAQT